MKLSLYRIGISVFLLTTITCKKIETKSALIPRSRELNARSRAGRTTYVKAILTNPKLSPTHVLAENLAKETLRSPRTQQTLKKLTEVRSVENRGIKNTSVPKKHHKKRKRKKHKHKPRRHHSRHQRDRKNRRKRWPSNQVSADRNGVQPVRCLKGEKIHVKRNDIDCTISRSILFNPIRHPLPMSDTFCPEPLERARISRQAPSNSSKRVIKRKPEYANKSSKLDTSIYNYDYFDPAPQVSVMNQNPLVNVPDYSVPQVPLRPIGRSPFRRQSNYLPQVQQTSGPMMNTRDLHVSKNDLGPVANSTSNCTTESTDKSEIAKSQAEHETAVELNVSTTVRPPQQAVEQTQGNFTGVETKQVASEILNEIIEELEELKVDHTRNNPREGLPCKIEGSWLTTQAGVEVIVNITNRTLHVSLEKMSPPAKFHTGILNHTWNISGHMPFKRGAPFSLVATNSYTKSLATFVGACRVCQGVDTIEGVWSLMREPSGCRDLQASTSIHTDTFRRVRDRLKRKKKKT